MGITQQIGASSIIKPGVCTSSTRPASPYEGQMIYETDTDLTYIYGGSAWQQVSGGTAVGNSGLVFVKSQAVGSTAVGSVVVTGAFSSTYDNYFITWQGGTMSGDTALKLQLGSTVTGYYGAFIYTPNYAGTTVSTVGDNNATSFTYSGGGNASQAQANFYLSGPNTATRTYINAGQISYGTVFGNYTGIELGTTQHTAFTFIPFSGTMANGTVSVYGYRK